MSQLRIHALASLPHYRRHVAAVWDHLDPTVKGEMVTGRAASTRGLPKGDVVMVGGFYDIERVPEHEVIYVEHGAGQSYDGDPTMIGHEAYHGGRHPDRVIGYISPNQRVADSWGKPAYAAGCPALDRRRVHLPALMKEPLVATITFHWDARRICPEAWSARGHYLDHLHNMVGHLRSQRFEVVGSAHPRDFRAAEIWRNLQVTFEPDPDKVLDTTDLLIADNTSLQYEAGKLGIPQIVLNCPEYRREVDHGLRFWDHVPGQMVDRIEEFMETHPRNIARSTAARVVAKSAGDYAFSEPLGDAGQKAARWIEKLVGELA